MRPDKTTKGSDPTRGEEVLREHEERCRLLLDTTLDGFALHEIICDENGTPSDYRFLEVNPAFETLTGLKRDETIGRTVRNVLPRAHERWIEAYGEAALTGKPARFEEHSRQSNKDYEVVASSPRNGLLVAIFRDITERKRAEEELRETHDFLENLIGHANAPIIVWNTENRITRFNHAFEHLTGYAADEVVGQELSMLFPEPSKEESLSRIAQTVGGERWESVEIPIQRKDGETRCVLWNSANIYSEDGTTLVATIAQGVDITERKRIEEELKKFKTVSDRASYGIAIADLEGRLLYVNDAFARMHGYTVEEVIGKYLSIFHTAEQMKEVNRLNEQMQREGSFTAQEAWHARKDGTVFPALMSGATVCDHNGNPLYLSVTAIDITERKRAEAALRESEERFRAIFESAEDCIFIKDRDLRYTQANAAMERLFELPASELIGRTDEDLFGQEAGAHIRDVDSHVLSGEIIEEEDVKPVKGVPRTFHVIKVPIRDDSGAIIGLGGIARDITERKRAEEERRKLEAQIQHAQKLESLGVLAGGIAHDFNNLLAGILGNADLALVNLPQTSPARLSIEEIKKAGRRASDLIQQMLAYSGKGQFVVKALDLNELVGEIGYLLQASISKKATLTFDLAEDLPPIEADAGQLQQVVMNLITNASDSISERAGVIVISTGVLDADQTYLSQGNAGDMLPEGRYVVLEVSDTGCGMDKATRTKIFDPFFSTKFTGRGLGLAAVLGIVRGHGGTIKVDSEPGAGTSFTVLFPCSDRPIEATEQGEGRTGQRQDTGTILIVDDEQLVSDVAKRILEHSGFTVLTAVVARQGVEVFREHAGQIAAVLLDMTMPEMSGEEVFREMRRIKPDVRVILTSGYNEQDAVSRFSEKGLAGFVHKPFEVDTLVRKVRQALKA